MTLGGIRDHLGSGRTWVALILVVVAGLLTAGYVRDHRRDVSTSPDAPIAIDPETRIDTLANGLQYYVRANAAPEGRAEFRLVVNAGSVLEDDDQQGLAHAIEHMAFRGTRRFPGNRVIDYLQSIGMRSGNDVNATTGFDETVYRLTVPTDSGSASAVDTAIAMLADWAHDVTFDSTVARREAGVVFEEWRSRTVAGQRLGRALDTLLLSGTRYAERFPIGDTAVVRRFDLSAMRRFYQRWYRPELMAVVAVGDFNPSEVETQIRRHFGAIPKSATITQRPSFSSPTRAGSRAAVLTDDEATGMRVALWYPRATKRSRTVRDYRESLVESIGRVILNERLAAVADASDAPLVNASISLQAVTRTTEAHVVNGAAFSWAPEQALRTLSEEVARLQRFGPSAAELSGAKDRLLEDRRRAEAYLDTSEDLAEGMTWHYLLGEPFAGREGDLKLANALVPTIEVADVKRFADRLSLERGAAIVVTTTPDATSSRRLTTNALAQAVQAAAEAATETDSDSLTLPTLISEPLERGAIASERYLREPDVFEWTLANGMRVLLKPTRFIDNEVLMRVTGPGGATLADAGTYPSAFLADQVLEATGVGPLSGNDFRRLLRATTVNLVPTVTDYGVQLSGSAESGEMELLFQLAHLFFTAPRADSAAFRRYHARSIAIARNRAADPNAAFDDSVSVALRPNDPRTLSHSTSFVSKVSLTGALEFWQARVRNASNFTLVLVGDFSLEGIRPLVQLYFASLPAGHRELSRTAAVAPPPAVVERSFQRGTLPKARTQLVFEGNLELTPVREVTLRALRDLLELVLESQLRETIGGIYDVEVELKLRPTPPASYVISVDFGAAPERIDDLAATVMNEVQRLCVKGPTDAEVSKVRAAGIRDGESDAVSNSYWASELEWRAQLGWTLESPSAHHVLVSEISVEGFRQACYRYLDPTRYLRVTMRPRNGAVTMHAGLGTDAR